MSSANLVEVIGIPEATYGTTPALATATGLTYRFVSETLSGTPTTVQSAELRTDRMSSGQVVVGLETGGDLAIELSRDPTYDLLFSMGLMNNWVTGATGTETAPYTVSGTNSQLATVVFTTFNPSNVDGAGRVLKVGDVMKLSGYTNAVNNGVRQVSKITLPRTIEFIVPVGTVTEAPGSTVTWTIPDYVDIGAIQKSLTLSKAYKDTLHLLTTQEHSQRYTGSLVSAFNVDLEYGAIVKGGFTFLSNGYLQENPSLHQAVTTAGGTITPPGTANPLNASVDMGLVTVDNAPTDYCIEKLTIALDNGLTPQNCIGKIAPTKYALGTAAIAVTMSIYLGDSAYDAFMPKKLSQVPIGVLMSASNAQGGYAFQLTALQLTFPDPAAQGANQQVLIDAAGVAKVGPGGTSSLRIHRL
jgi:hypothetical protein